MIDIFGDEVIPDGSTPIPQPKYGEHAETTNPVPSVAASVTAATTTPKTNQDLASRVEQDIME
jgi:hypothetical protein